MKRAGADLVALVLAVGVVLVLAVLASVALVDALEANGAARAPSENLTQILATILGGVVGALAAYLGRRGTDPATRPGPTGDTDEPVGP